MAKIKEDVSTYEKYEKRASSELFHHAGTVIPGGVTANIKQFAPYPIFMKEGPMKIDRQSYEVTIGSKTLYLPLKEFELLSVLASRINHVFPREFLIERVWGIDYEGDDQTLNVHIKRLRDKLRHVSGDLKIATVRGVGYKLEVADS